MFGLFCCFKNANKKNSRCTPVKLVNILWFCLLTKLVVASYSWSTLRQVKECSEGPCSSVRRIDLIWSQGWKSLSVFLYVCVLVKGKSVSFNIHLHTQTHTQTQTDEWSCIDLSRLLVLGNSYHWLWANHSVWLAKWRPPTAHSTAASRASPWQINTFSGQQQCKQTLQTSVSLHHISSHKDFNWQLGGTIRTHCSTRLRANRFTPGCRTCCCCCSHT